MQLQPFKKHLSNFFFSLKCRVFLRGRFETARTGFGHKFSDLPGLDIQTAQTFSRQRIERPQKIRYKSHRSFPHLQESLQRRHERVRAAASDDHFSLPYPCFVRDTGSCAAGFLLIRQKSLQQFLRGKFRRQLQLLRLGHPLLFLR